MSDPVSKVEIEDVLSSIRRLVSVDNSRTKRKSDPESETAAQPAPNSKLVLTDDLRIPPQPELVTQDQINALGQDYTETLQRRIAELEAAVTAQANEFEPDGSEDTTQHRPTSVLFPAKPETDSNGAVDLDVLISETVENAPHLDADRTTSQDAPTPPEQQVDAMETDAETPEKTKTTAPMEEADVDHGDMWSDDAPVSISQSKADEAVEIFDAESHSKTSQKNTDGDFVFSTDDTVIDEEALRDMVAEIVREELQGALGERITRNVRKLVRREIMRAISIRDFE